MNTERLIEKVNKIRKDGVSVKQACEDVGLSVAKYTYYTYGKGSPAKAKKARKLREDQITVHQVPLVSKKVAVFYGDVEEIAALIGRLQ